MSGPGYIKPEPPSTCELCGKFEETRPYGPKGERVCIECAHKDPEATKRGMERYIFRRPVAAQAQPDVRHTYRGPSGYCPRCNHTFDAHTHASNEMREAPRPGDASICLQCGLLMKFTRTMQLREMTPREIAKASEEDKKSWNELLTARKLVMERGSEEH